MKYCLWGLCLGAAVGVRAACPEMEVWDYDMAMCQPLPMPDMPMRMLMLQGNSFFAGVAGQGPRGRSEWAAPNMFMADLGTSLGDRQYLNLDAMFTLEKWTLPRRGYPLPLQIGEADAQGRAFVDAQHPHSSPIMGLTLSDTIKLDTGPRDHLKLSFAPRGQSTDGPVAFMHRATGQVNPDAPLGHHIGQDVGHISSTVLALSARFGDTTLQGSGFNGTEPEPTAVDLPIGALNSFGLRVIHEFTPATVAMASVARVQGDGTEWRASASLYQQADLASGTALRHALIYGALRAMTAPASTLHSVGEEFVWQGDRPRLWGRLEILQRTGAQLEIPALAAPARARWVTAATLGYSHVLARPAGLELALGASATKDFLPAEFRGAYGGNPWSGKVFVQLAGSGMWDL